MILSNIAIQAAIDAGDIVIDPEPLPRLSSLQGGKSPYDTTAVNLRLSPSLSVCRKSMPMTFDLRTSGLPDFLKDHVYEPVTMDQDGGYCLPENQFVLGNTVEILTLPVRPGHPVYAARVEGRSSFARCGLLVHFTAPTIHANFSGTITFEIMNFGKHPITLHPGLPIGQLIFERVDGEPALSESQFQNQRTPAGTKK